MIRKDIRLLLNDRRVWILLAVTAILVAAGAIFSNNTVKTAVVRLGVVDNEKSEYSGLLLNYFADNDVFSSYVSISEGDEESINRQFDEGKLDIYLVIPEKFSEELIKLNNIPIKAVISTADKTKSVLMTNLLNAYSDYITAVEVNCQSLYEIMKLEEYDTDLINDTNVKISYDLIFTALGKDTFFERTELQRFLGISLADYYIYSGIMLLILYAAMFAGMNIFYEKNSGIISRLMTTGAGKAGILTKKLIFFTVVFSITGIVAAFIAGMAGRKAVPVEMAAVLVITVFLMCFLFLLGGMLFKSIQGYMIAGNMYILLTTIIGGGIIPIMYLPQAIVKVAGFTPNYWFIRFMLQFT